MNITISQNGLSAAVAGLNKNSTPRQKITQAIRQALRETKSESQRLVNARYVRRITPLGKISARASGMSGSLKISGSRNLIKKFKLSPSTRPPHRPPGGLHVQVVKGQGGWLPHAFVNRNGIVFEREGRARLPIQHLNTVSTPGGYLVFSDKILNRMERRLKRRLEAALS